MIQGKFIPGIGDTAEAFAIRREVFVQEQGFAAGTEFDEIDKTALHVLVMDDGRPAATARLYQHDGCWHIGRVAVRQAHRGRGVGAVAMRLMMQKARALGAQEVHIGAQTQAEGFYRGLGFAPCGPEYDEEGVPHVPMKAQLADGCGCCSCSCH